MQKLEIREEFYLNGQALKIISGAIHYFRVVPEYWRDRLEKLKALGCNTVETYIPWNMHEKEKGQFSFEGILDIQKFVSIAQELDLYVILRPSPYICAEWEFGGLPAWLLREEDMRVRTNTESFMRHVREYYEQLMPIIVPLQSTKGGPVILMQVENEYGYYGSDKNYLEALKAMYIEFGVDVPLVTSDGPEQANLECGSLDNILATGNFGTFTDDRYETTKKFIGNKPFFCMEFWVGWFDHWGNGGHMTGDLEEGTRSLDKILEHGNVNIYMFHGGTNFGFMNGSNYNKNLTPDVTSYDYDAVLTEDGEITEKYKRFQEVISKYTEIPEVPLSTEIKRCSYGTIEVQARTGLFESLGEISQARESVNPLSMEQCGQSYGYILYRSKLDRQKKIRSIELLEANDRANIFLDGQGVAVLYDRELLEEVKLDDESEHSSISILVENMGRVNFGKKMDVQRKGINRSVMLNNRAHNNWKHYPLSLENIDELTFTQPYTEGQPSFHKFVFEAKEIGDTFLDFEGWGKGCVFVNGFNIGRFWEIGPQKRLYIPGPLLKEGENTIVLFETDGKVLDTIKLESTPDVGELKVRE